MSQITSQEKNHNLTNPHPQEHITHYVFSHRLIHVMNEYPMRSIELARRIYVSRSTIAGYRSGRRIPDLERLRLICVHLQVSADYLLGLKGSPYIESPKQLKHNKSDYGKPSGSVEDIVRDPVPD